MCHKKELFSKLSLYLIMFRQQQQPHALSSSFYSFFRFTSSQFFLVSSQYSFVAAHAVFKLLMLWSALALDQLISNLCSYSSSFFLTPIHWILDTDWYSASACVLWWPWICLFAWKAVTKCIIGNNLLICHKTGILCVQTRCCESHFEIENIIRTKSNSEDCIQVIIFLAGTSTASFSLLLFFLSFWCHSALEIPSWYRLGSAMSHAGIRRVFSQPKVSHKADPPPLHRHNSLLHPCQCDWRFYM